MPGNSAIQKILSQQELDERIIARAAHLLRRMEGYSPAADPALNTGDRASGRGSTPQPSATPRRVIET